MHSMNVESVASAIIDTRKALTALKKSLKRELCQDLDVWTKFDNAVECHEQLASDCQQLVKKHKSALNVMAVVTDALLSSAQAIAKA